MKLALTHRIAAVWALSLITAVYALVPSSVLATKYGAGSYGRCQYQTCAIALASSTTVNVNVIPSSAGVRCSVASDTVTVTTSSSTGYLLTLIDGDSSTALSSSGTSIPVTSGTYASPAVLTANSWGYRVDGQGNFGSGPAGALSNATSPAYTFAQVQPSTGTADTLINSAVAATNGTSKSVWYGVCVNSSQASGTYSDSVLYTAVVN